LLVAIKKNEFQVDVNRERLVNFSGTQTITWEVIKLLMETFVIYLDFEYL